MRPTVPQALNNQGITIMHARSLALALAVITTPLAAFAAKQQVNSDAYRAAGKSGAYYGRADGIYQEVNSKGLVPVVNGEAQGSIGGAYRETFAYGDGKGLTCEDQSAMGACAGNAALVPCLCTFGSGNKLIWQPLLQQDIAPDMDATSLDIAGDQTDNDGALLIGGIGGASGRPFAIGDDAAFYLCATIAVEDASGVDAMNIGFVEVQNSEVWNADFEARNSYAGIGIIGTAASGLTTGVITIKTEDDGAGVTTTSTTDLATQAVAYKFCTHVGSTGAVTYTVNGSAPTAVAAFSFDDGIMVVPYLSFLHTNDVAGEIDLTLWEVGYTE
jgi:hypothetical protein